jgi:hypothetical protein
MHKGISNESTKKTNQLKLPGRRCHEAFNVTDTKQENSDSDDFSDDLSDDSSDDALYNDDTDGHSSFENPIYRPNMKETDLKLCHNFLQIQSSIPSHEIYSILNDVEQSSFDFDNLNTTEFSIYRHEIDTFIQKTKQQWINNQTEKMTSYMIP